MESPSRTPMPPATTTCDDVSESGSLRLRIGKTVTHRTGREHVIGSHQAERSESLQLLARLEPNSLARPDADLLPGSRVATHSRLARLDVKDSEPPQLNP